jgi:FkbM family methyltransferase
MRDQLRNLARKYLPESLRKTLGSLAGKFDNAVIRPAEGLFFDLSGGHFKADGCTFAIPKDLTSRAYRSCFLDGSYEAEERALIRSFVKPEDQVLEVGACLGIVSCVTNRLLRDKTRHVVVEGNPFCIPSLHKNRHLNQCGFLVENCAVSNRPDVTFYLHPVYIVGGTAQRKSDRPVRVPGQSLLELDQRHGPFSTLVMDIEGAELEALEHSRAILRNYRLVIVEFHDWAIGAEGVARCQKILGEAGLRFVQKVGATECWQR